MLLRRYAAWLVEEAVPGGGLGPREAERLWDRHIADSVAFLAGFDRPPPRRLVDAGSGVGLPGIPLGIVLPSTTVTLLDRAARRAHLARRAVRILGLENVDVIEADAERHGERYPGAVARGLAGPGRTCALLRRLLEPSGIGVVGLARGVAPPPIPAEAGPGARLVEVPVLDSPAWLLRMEG